MSAWRGHTLIIEKSHLRTKAVVLRDVLTMQILHSHNSRKKAESYCRREGFSWMNPTEMPQERLEMTI